MEYYETLLNELTESVEPSSKEYREKAHEHILDIATPPWALGRLYDLAEDLCAMQRTLTPNVAEKRILTMAADHGVAEEGVSAFPQEVTVQMAQNILLGGAGVNVLGKCAGCDVTLVDMGVKEDLTGLEGADERLKAEGKFKNGSGNIRKGPAMTREEAARAVLAGAAAAIDAVDEGATLLGTGELGIGNTTPAAAILSVMSGISVEEATGRGTGVDDEGLKNKIRVIEDAIDVNNPDPSDALDVLSKVGGLDIAGIAGSILAAASMHVPIFVDGFISTAGAMIAYGLCPTAADYMIPSHRSVEQGHDAMWKQIGKEPLLDLNMRLGEGTGGAVAMHLADVASHIMSDMLTFSDAGVSTSETASEETFD